MKKQTKLFFGIFLSVLLIFLIRPGVSKTLALTVNCERSSTFEICTAECNNGPSNRNSGGCGTACVPLCDNTEFIGGDENKNDCLVEMKKTDTWTKYNAKRATIYEARLWGWPNTTFSLYWADNVCSTADKCRYNYCANPTSPVLRAGNCKCGEGEVGGAYKVCCNINTSSKTVTPVNAIKSYTQDNFLPEEGVCPSNARTVIWQTDCPLFPVVDLNVVKIEGDQATISWTSSNAKSCELKDGSSKTPVSLSGSTTVSASPSRTISIECENTYKYVVGNDILTGVLSGQDSVDITGVPDTRINYYFCRTDTDPYQCQQTSQKYASATECQAALEKWWKDKTTGVCYPDQSACAAACQSATPPPQPPAPPPDAGDDVIFNSLRVNGKSSNACIPQQPGEKRNTTVSWSVSIKNSCPALPDNPNVSIPVSSSSNCSPATWTSDWYLVSPSSYQYSCSAYGGWSGSKSLNGSESINPPAFTTTYGLTCRRTDTYTCGYRRNYSYERYECVDGYWETRTREVIDPVTGETTTEEYQVWICTRRDCVTYSGSVSGTGPTFGPSTASREVTLAVVQPLTYVTLEAKTNKILYKTSTELSWSSSALSSGVSTYIKCTPGIKSGGDDTNWKGPVNSFNASDKRTISPQKTTTYQLSCRNIYQYDSACYTERSAPSQTIEVYEPILEERSPGSL